MRSEDNSDCAPPASHYWVIPPAQGRYSWGVCKHCGDTRRFVNTLTDPSLWIHKHSREEDAV